jgi:hypothetical protein
MVSSSRMQNVAQLYSMLRTQDFDLYDPNPRMLPRQFNPTQLNVECAPPSPCQPVAEEEPTMKKGSRKNAAASSGR